MEKPKIYGLEKEQYRIIEKENRLGEKFYFLQYCWFGCHFYKFSFIKCKYNTQPIRSELAWIYILRDKDKI
jgi:hypothetical protein